MIMQLTTSKDIPFHSAKSEAFALDKSSPGSVASFLKQKLNSTQSLSMNRVRKVRKAMFARLFSNDIELEDSDSNVICSRVSLVEVTKFLEKQESLGFRIRFDPEQHQDDDLPPEKVFGKLIAVEIPSHTHEVAASEITRQIVESVRDIVDGPSLLIRGSATYRIGNSLKEPDSSLSPLGHETERVFRKTTTVVEIDFRHGTTEQLKSTLSAWVSAESFIQTAIGIKISEMDGDRCGMLALLYDKGASNPVQEIEFGTDVPNVEGLVLKVSLRNLFFRAHGVQKPALRALLRKNSKINVNLAKLQNLILKVCICKRSFVAFSMFLIACCFGRASNLMPSKKSAAAREDAAAQEVAAAQLGAAALEGAAAREGGAAQESAAAQEVVVAQDGGVAAQEGACAAALASAAPSDRRCDCLGVMSSPSWRAAPASEGPRGVTRGASILLGVAVLHGG